MPIRPQQVRDSADGGEWQVQQSRARRLTASQLLYPPPAMPVSPKGECVLHYVPYGAFRSSHCSSPTARRPMAPSHAVVRSNARSLEGTCSFIHRLFAPSRPWRGGGKNESAPHVPKSGTSGAFYPLFRAPRPSFPDVRRVLTLFSLPSSLKPGRRAHPCRSDAHQTAAGTGLR